MVKTVDFSTLAPDFTLDYMQSKLSLWAYLAVSVVLLISLNSCHVLNSSIMLEADKKFAYDSLKLDSANFSAEYRLAPDDVIELRLFANDGFKMVDLITSGGATPGNALARQGFEYIIDVRGYAKLPILGMVKLDSMTLREAELHLEERYSVYYVNPFVLMRVINRRVIVFPGDPGRAQVIGLNNSNTTVFEAIAQAGGITENGKANNIKLIRQTDDPGHPKVFRIDLSKIENVEQGNIVVQSNDIIYVEPRRRLASRTLQEVSPILSLFTSALTIYLIFSRGL